MVNCISEARRIRPEPLSDQLNGFLLHSHRFPKVAIPHHGVSQIVAHSKGVLVSKTKSRIVNLQGTL